MWILLFISTEFSFILTEYISEILRWNTSAFARPQFHTNGCKFFWDFSMRFTFAEMKILCCRAAWKFSNVSMLLHTDSNGICSGPNESIYIIRQHSIDIEWCCSCSMCCRDFSIQSDQAKFYHIPEQNFVASLSMASPTEAPVSQIDQSVVALALSVFHLLESAQK